MTRPESLEQALAAVGIESLLPWQDEVVTELSRQASTAAEVRACIYHPTGKGKTYSSLLGMWALGVTDLLIVAPPATQPDWRRQAEALGFTTQVMSHAKFRRKDTKVSRTQAIIVDEFHMLGGRKGQGWLKLKRMARGLQAPLLFLSATPSYNDAERVYCVWHILDPNATAGGFEKFLLDHCELEPSFRGLPKVVGFHKYDDAEHFLSSLPGVFHEPDEARYTITDWKHVLPMPPEWVEFGYDSRKDLIMASIMERKISYQRYQILRCGMGLKMMLRKEIEDWLNSIIQEARASTGRVLIYCDHSTVALATMDSLNAMGYKNIALLDGKTSASNKEKIVDWFREDVFPVWQLEAEPRILVGTATMATGTDGFDKVCDTLVLLQDTQDDSLRRQIVGRILPRGKASAQHNKKFYRLDVGTP